MPEISSGTIGAGRFCRWNALDEGEVRFRIEHDETFARGDTRFGVIRRAARRSDIDEVARLAAEAFAGAVQTSVGLAAVAIGMIGAAAARAERHALMRAVEIAVTGLAVGIERAVGGIGRRLRGREHGQRRR